MEDLIERGELPLGVMLQEANHVAYALRTARLEDAYRAAAAVSLPDNVDTNVAARLAYQMAIDDAVILSQLVSLGSMTTMPSIQELVQTIDPDDMSVLRAAAERLKKKLQESRGTVRDTALSSATSSGSASP